MITLTGEDERGQTQKSRPKAAFYTGGNGGIRTLHALHTADSEKEKG
jgi:hypothetical protein